MGISPATPHSEATNHCRRYSLLWAAVGALSVGQYTLLDAYRGEPLQLGALLLADFLPWQIWALATPAILAAERRWPVSWRRLRWLPLHLALNAAVGLLFVWTEFHCARLAGMEPFVGLTARQMVPPMLLKSGLLLLMLYWGVIAAERSLAWQRRYREGELQRAQLEARLVEAQLDTLRMQLRPHFLFNTLNAIAVLVRKDDRPGAIRMINGLGDLLRRSLGTLRVERVALREELDFLALYLDIALVRFSDRLAVQVDAEPEALDAAVPSLLLQPLVENALEHGIAPRVSGGRLEIEARLRGDRLHLEIRDDGVGLREGHREGVGLSHVRERLAQLYPGAHRFVLEPGPLGGTRATLELPLGFLEPGRT